MKITKSHVYKSKEFSILINQAGETIQIKAVNSRGEDIIIRRSEEFPPLTLSGTIGMELLDKHEVANEDQNNPVTMLMKSMEDKIKLAIDMGMGINI